MYYCTKFYLYIRIFTSCDLNQCCRESITVIFKNGFGTVYEGLEKIGISGDDAVLVTGLGPVGLAALMLAKICSTTS